MHALARPPNLLAHGEAAPDLASLAAAYAYGIARNHPFVDGNKRTALVAARTFLILNGVDLEATQDDKVLTFLIWPRAPSLKKSLRIGFESEFTCEFGDSAPSFCGRFVAGLNGMRLVTDGN